VGVGGKGVNAGVGGATTDGCTIVGVGGGCNDSSGALHANKSKINRMGRETAGRKVDEKSLEISD
jgi:hypothetical protein